MDRLNAIFGPASAGSVRRRTSRNAPGQPSLEHTVHEQHAAGENKHSHQPAHCACEERGVNFWEWEFCKLFTALQHPVPAGVDNERRQDDDPEPFRNHKSEQKPKCGYQNDENYDLSDFDSDVESKQRRNKMIAGKL